jgi:Tfp pilus assembly protein PilF
MHAGFRGSVIAFEANYLPCYTKFTMSDEIARQQALILLERANRHLAKGEFADAMIVYNQSLATWPTSSAYIGLGQVYSRLDRNDEAIDCCQKAIAIDSTLGEPYNDLGVYLINLGRWEEAIPWLEKATEAESYDSPQLPQLHLGHIHSHLGHYGTALMHLDRSIELDPFHRPAIWAKFALLAKMS